jgi:inositol-phosphate transport system permease protein
VSSHQKTWPLSLFLGIVSFPLVLMYLYLVIDTVTVTAPGSIIPDRFSLEDWRFLFQGAMGSRPSIWSVTLNSFIFATANSIVIVSISATAGYALSRLNVPFRSFFLAGMMVLHAFPTVTLIIAIFIILQMVGLYNTLIGVILVKASLLMPFGIWIMKGFYDTVPWEIEMAGVLDGASRFTVWRRLVLPQVQPGFLALGIFAFLDGWSEFILPQVLAPSSDVQVLSVYLAGLIADDFIFDLGILKAVGLFYSVPVILRLLFFQDKLMNIYGGGSKG